MPMLADSPGRQIPQLVITTPAGSAEKSGPDASNSPNPNTNEGPKKLLSPPEVMRIVSAAAGDPYPNRHASTMTDRIRMDGAYTNLALSVRADSKTSRQKRRRLA